MTPHAGRVAELVDRTADSRLLLSTDAREELGPVAVALLAVDRLIADFLDADLAVRIMRLGRAGTTPSWEADKLTEELGRAKMALHFLVRS